MSIETTLRLLMGDAAMDQRLREWDAKIEAEWRRLSDFERVTLMGLCCRFCGTLKPDSCHCKYMENDE